MKFSELKGRAVVSLDDAAKIGTVEDILMDQINGHIMSLKVRTGLLSSAQVVPVGDIKNVGADAVTLTANTLPADPASSGHGATSAATTIALTSILGTKVVTDAGTMVGQLSDVVIDWANLAITGYEVRDSGMFAKSQAFTLTPEVRFGDKIVTIPAQLLSNPA